MVVHKHAAEFFRRGGGLDNVELFSAFSWICDNCGKRNFERGVTLELTQENEAHLKEQMGLQPWEELPQEDDGEWMIAPAIVTCKYCATKYKTLDKEDDTPA